GRAMRLKSAIWVAAYVRRCHSEGAFAAVRRRGAEEAGAIFVKLNRLDGTAELFGPAPQSAFDEERPSGRLVRRCLAGQPPPEAAGEDRRGAEGRAALRSRCLDRRGRGPRRTPFPRSGHALTDASRAAGSCSSRSLAEIASRAAGGPRRSPCRKCTPAANRKRSCSASSTPSAISLRPSARPMLTTACTMVESTVVLRLATKMRSILIILNGNSRR